MSNKKWRYFNKKINFLPFATILLYAEDPSRNSGNLIYNVAEATEHHMSQYGAIRSHKNETMVLMVK